LQSLFEIKRKIKTIEGIKKVVKATSLIANTRLQNIFSKFNPLKIYSDSLYSCCSDIYKHFNPFVLQEKCPLFTKRKTLKLLMIVFTSDKGLCGSYNTKVIDRISSESKNFIKIGRKLHFISFGRFAKDFLSKANREVIKSYSAITLANFETLSNEIACFCFDSFLSKLYDEIYVVYNSHEKNNVIMSKILPMDFSESTEKNFAENTIFRKSDFEVDNNDISIIRNIFEKFFRFNISKVMIDSLAKEYFERMLAMQQSTKNAEELIDDLILKYNKIRQFRITREMLEIISSAEALK